MNTDMLSHEFILTYSSFDLKSIIKVGINVGAILGPIILGIIIQQKWDEIKAKLVENRKLRRKLKWKRGKDSKNLFIPLYKYYKKRKLEDILYQAEIGHIKKRIPFLIYKNWYGNDFQKKLKITLSNPIKNSSIEVDNKFIDLLREYGYELFNDPSFFVTSINETDQKIELELGICDYFQYVSSCGKLQYETILNKEKLRNMLLSSEEKLIDFTNRTCSLGTICQIAIKNGESYNLVIVGRSEKTVSHGNKPSAIPCFSFAPFTYDVLNEISYKHQIIREFYEELYNKDAFIRSNKHLSYDFFYHDRAVSLFIENLNDKKIELIPLGFGFDALNGEPNLSFLILIKDREYWLKEKKEIELNWEANGKYMTFVDKLFDDPSLGDLIESDNFYIGSIFAISETIKYLKAISNLELKATHDDRL